MVKVKKFRSSPISKEEKVAVIQGVAEFQKEFSKEVGRQSEEAFLKSSINEYTMNAMEMAFEFYLLDEGLSDEEAFNNAYTYVNKQLEDHRDEFSSVLTEYLDGAEFYNESKLDRYDRFCGIEGMVSRVQ